VEGTSKLANCPQISQSSNTDSGKPQWFNLNLNSGQWTDIWELNPGATGAAAGERYSVSNVIIDKDQAGK
jgi:hypothetical protein